MVKLVVVIMGPGNENFIQMALDSVKDADRILYFSSNPEKVKPYFPEVMSNDWDDSDKNINGKARNVYLNYLKKNYPNDYCLVIDEDEVVEDLSKIKEFIQTAQQGIYSVKMRHFIGSLGWEDNTQQNHWVPNRLFKISEARTYPLDSHPVLEGKVIGVTDCTTIWHLGHLPVDYMHYIQKRYSEHADNSTIHSQQFLKSWKNAHFYGTYPTRQVNPIEIPKIILDNFGIDFDELYFRDRQKMEAKHYQDAIDWKNYFKVNSMTLLGCGFGQRVKILNEIGVDAMGIELSKYAVDNTYSDGVKQGDIINYEMISDVTIAYDVLEHLKYENLDKIIENMIKNTNKQILISVPFKGTPNATADPTHIIIEDREWWVSKFEEKGCKLIETPSHFLYKEQLLIFEVNKDDVE